MPIQFADITIPGTVLAQAWEPPALLLREVPRWGVMGLSTISSRVGSRHVEVLFKLHDNEQILTYEQLRRWLDLLDTYTGVSGELVVSTDAPMARRYANCLFQGATPLVGPTHGPIFDPVCLNSWLIDLRLVFLQRVIADPQPGFDRR